MMKIDSKFYLSEEDLDKHDYALEVEWVEEFFILTESERKKIPEFYLDYSDDIRLIKFKETFKHINKGYKYIIVFTPPVLDNIAVSLFRNNETYQGPFLFSDDTFLTNNLEVAMEFISEVIQVYKDS